MKYDLSKKLLDEKGKPIQEKDVFVDVKTAVLRALISDYTEEGRPPSGDVKMKRYQLFQKLADPASSKYLIELTVDEAAILKTCLGGFPTLIYGQLVTFLDKGE